MIRIPPIRRRTALAMAAALSVPRAARAEEAREVRIAA